jgi:DNA repair exonuclease SbcCD ATPase subunit
MDVRVTTAAGKEEKMAERSDYLKKLEAQLEEWDAEIDKLQAKTKGAQADAQRQYAELLSQFRTRRKEAVAMMDKFQKAGEDAQKDMQVGLEAAWSSLRDAMSKAQSRFS